MNSEFAIEARGLSKHFGELRAVSNLNLDVPRGQIYGFLGPNGSGKSTTIRMLCGLLTPTEGNANVLGTKIPGDARLLKPKIGYMTQKFSLFGDLTVFENLQFIAEIYSYPRAERAARIEKLLENYDLGQQRKQLTKIIILEHFRRRIGKRDRGSGSLGVIRSCFHAIFRSDGA